MRNKKGRVVRPQFCIQRLAPHAANALGAHDIDQVSNVVHARHVPNRFLNQLFQIERGQPPGEEKRAAAVLDENIADPSAEMRMVLKLLASQRAQVESFAWLSGWSFRQGRLHIYSSCRHTPTMSQFRVVKMGSRRGLEKSNANPIILTPEISPIPRPTSQQAACQKPSWAIQKSE